MLEYEEILSGIIPGAKTPANWDHSIRPNWIDAALNFNSIPYNSNVGIIVTSWHGHLPWMKATLKNYRLTGKYVLVAYDQPFEPWDAQDMTALLPSRDIFLLANSWVFKHPTFDSKKRDGWFWDVRYAQGIINQFEFDYVLTVNSDCIWEKPEGINDLVTFLEDYDLMSISSEQNCIHTCAIIWKKEAFNSVINYMNEFYRVPVIGSFSPEVLLVDAVRNLGIREKIAPVQPRDKDGYVDHYCRYNQHSTWKDLVGFRNLGSEHLTACVERTEPVPLKYVDLRYKNYFGQTGANSVVNYYETGDYRWLLKFWDEEEDSYYDRVYYSLDCYGSQKERN